MAETSRMAEPDLHAAVANAYRVFAPYRLHGRMEVCRCNCCVGPEQERLLMITPLTQISSALLAEHTNSAHSWSEQVADELRYFLPRYFDLLAADDVPCHLGIEICLARLANVPYRSDWPRPEAEAIDDFFVALLRARLDAPALFVGEGGLPASHAEAGEDVLCMVAHAGGDLDPLLGVWNSVESRDAVLRLARMIGAADWLKGRLRNSSWYDAVPPHAIAAMQQVIAWLLRPQTRARLEAACLDEADPAATALLSHAESLVAGLARQRKAASE